MRKLALPVRLAHMVAKAAECGEALAAAELAVLLSERGLGGNSVDLDQRLANFRRESSPRAKAARQLAQGLARQAGGSMGNGASSAGALLLHAWPDRVAKARGEAGRYVLANGRGGQMEASEALAREPYLVVADLQGRAQNARIAAAARVDEQEIETALGDRIETRRTVSFDRERRALRQTESRRLGSVVFATRNLPPPSGADADEGLLEAIRAHGLDLLPWTKETAALRARLAFLHHAEGEPWPAMDDETLLAMLEDWLGPFLKGDAELAKISSRQIEDGLRSLVPFDRQRRLDALAPTHFTAPTGSRVPIRYEAEDAVLSIRVQELFGLGEHPTIGGGTRLTLELLSPAHRPIQKTRDLPGFWAGSWADVRSDMRGRYPKHVWPEDPASAAATRRAKPRAK
jgi:ATP-dependent helicase HrpB